MADSSGRSAILLACMLALQGCLFSAGSGAKANAPGTLEFNPVPRGYYTFAFPDMAADLDLDSAYAVSWSASDSAGGDPVRLSIYRNGVFASDLSSDSGLKASGELDWSLPSTISPGGYHLGSGADYRLRITNTSDSSKWDFGPRFRIHSRFTGSLRLTSPVRGSRANVNSVFSVTWIAKGEVGDFVGVELYAGKSLIQTISSSAFAVSDPVCYWPVSISPRLPGDDYQIRVFSGSDPSIESREPVRIAYSGSFAFRSTGAGDAVLAGSNVEAVWSVSGTPGVLASISLRNESSHAVYHLYTVNSYYFSSYWTVPGGLSSGQYRLRISGSPDTGMPAFSPAFFVKALGPDDYEGDGSLPSAKPIAADGTPQSRTLTLNDTDWIRFEAETGNRYLTRYLPSGNKGDGLRDGSRRLEVFDSAGRLLVAKGMSPAVFAPTYSGTHYLRVSPFFSALSGPDSALAYGPYRFSLTGYDSAHPVAYSSPAADTIWEPGRTHTIRWAPDTVIFGQTVFLWLYQDTARVNLLAAPIPNSGAYDWKINGGIRTGSKFRIRMEAPPYFSPIPGLNFAYSPFFTIGAP